MRLRLFWEKCVSTACISVALAIKHTGTGISRFFVSAIIVFCAV